jgi:hypothetical protein
VEELRVFESIWDSKAPLKVVAFSWKLLLDRIPTRRNLARRNCLSPEVSSRCGLCRLVEESANHLFLHCNVSSVVWERVMRWLDFSFIMPPNLFVHWACWSNEGRSKRIRKGLWIIWHATIWAIWQARNHMIFRNEDKHVDDIVSEIVVNSWRRSLSKLNMQSVYIMNGIGILKSVF